MTNASHTDAISAVAKRLHSLRIKADVSQHELAEWSGVAQHSISNYEAGNILPTLPSLIKLGRAYRMSVAEILDGVI